MQTADGSAADRTGMAPAPAIAARFGRPLLLGRARRLADWARRAAIGQKLAVILAILAVCAAVGTYAALAGMASFRDTRLVLILLQIDLVLFLLLGLVVARNLVRLRYGRRKGQAASRLHRRLVFLFSLIALVPAVSVSMFSAMFLNLGFEAWFSDRVRTAVLDSRAVAEAYLKEHQQAIRGDALSMARDLDRAASLAHRNSRAFSQIVATHGVVRNLSEAYVFDGTGRILARWKQGFILAETPLPLDAVDRAREGEVVVLTGPSDDRVRAVIRLDRLVDAFLYLGRYVEPSVLAHIAKTRQAADEYQNIEGWRTQVEVTFAMIYVLIGLLLLLAAIWVGQIFANRISAPVSALAEAAETAGAGNLSVRVEEDRHADEIGLLGRSFNRMTSQLEAQHRDLVKANDELAERTQFVEAVLSGVSAGVIGLDEHGCINVANRSASALLERDLKEEIGTDIRVLVPEVGDMIARARRRSDPRVETEISFRNESRERRLSVCLTSERLEDTIIGFVVTFDDITELMAAQRKAAWSDVARRIAHEIRNPLTPIQLAADRLRRKYLSEIRSDPATFSDCTDTIIRRVGEIGRMVDEFSEFARMPEAEIAPADICAICREALVLPTSARPDIDFVTSLPPTPIEIPCDSPQIAQVLTNLIQNAVDAIDRRPASRQSGPRGRVEVALTAGEEGPVIEISDNGVGLQGMAVDRLTEPYVTTREGGTGLGLAIVKKVLEDHRGELALADRAEGGTTATVRLPSQHAGTTKAGGGGGHDA